MTEQHDTEYDDKFKVGERYLWTKRNENGNLGYMAFVAPPRKKVYWKYLGKSDDGYHTFVLPLKVVLPGIDNYKQEETEFGEERYYVKCTQPQIRVIEPESIMDEEENR